MNKTYFTSRFTFDPGREVVWSVLCKIIQKDIPAHAKILDIGAGYCNFINNIIAQEKHALDNASDLSTFASKDVTIHLRPCSDLSCFQDDYFDFIFSSNLFEHLSREDFEKTIEEVMRVLRVGGRLGILQPNYKYCFKNYFDDYTHRLVFSHVSLSDVLKAGGFNVVKIIPRYLPFSIKSANFPVFRLMIKLYMFLPFKPFARQMYIIAEKKKTD